LITKISIFFNQITDSLLQKKPFVAYQKPNSKEITLRIQEDNQVHFLKDFSQSGFIFAPFDDQKNTIIFSNSTCKTIISLNDNKQVEKHASKTKLTNDLLLKNKHINLVEKGIDFINNNSIKKIVLSRKELIKITDFNAVETFKKLLQNYKTAFVYIWYHPKIGLWLGATPETLLEIKGNSFNTMSLAGTQVYKNTLAVTWQKKEKQEQQFVTDYIIQKLKKLEIDVDQSNPFTIKAGELLHICTTISGELTTKNELASIIETLHPTPAVCGLPKNITKQFILQNENYNRAFYTGFLGELNCNDSSSLFVNLRCMQVKNDSIKLYIGGGITKDSNPEKEFQETVDKAAIMKKVLYS
jgi:isochorismate synthase